MIDVLAPSLYSIRPGLFSASPFAEGESRRRRKDAHAAFAILATAALLILSATLLFAQDSPRVVSVDPTSAKVNATVTVAGENLGKSHVSAVFLSDAKTDYKATVVEQTSEKIVMKVPQVAPGEYNVSVQSGNQILIEPVRFTVER